MLHVEELHNLNEINSEKIGWLNSSILSMFMLRVERKGNNEPSQVVLAGKIQIIFPTAEL